MADANPWAFILQPRQLRRVWRLAQARDRIMRLATIPMGLAAIALIFVRYRHLHLPIDSPIARAVVLYVLPFFIILAVGFIMAWLFMDLAVTYGLIRCPKCHNSFFHSEGLEANYSQCCCHCGLSVAPGRF